MEIIDDPWTVREEFFPKNSEPSQKLKFMLNYAVLAPSISNSQPWIFRPAGDGVELYADRSRNTGGGDPDGRQSIVSCGASLFNLRIAAAHFGFEPVVRTFPHMDTPDLLASVRLGAPRTATPEESKLFSLLHRREKDRESSETRKVPLSTLKRLEQAAGREGALIKMIDVKGQPSLAPLMNGAGPATAAPVVGVLSTRADNPFEWLAAGQALAHLLLTARALRLRAALWSPPVEIDSLRARLATAIDADQIPQVVLRIGYGNGGESVPRRPVHDVLASF